MHTHTHTHTHRKTLTRRKKKTCAREREREGGKEREEVMMCPHILAQGVLQAVHRQAKHGGRELQELACVLEGVSEDTEHL